MIQVLLKTLSSFLALLVLLSTISWSGEKHLCMGRVMDVSLFQSVESCGIGDALALLETDMEKHCCSNESFTIQGQDDLKLSWDELEIDSQMVLVAYVQSYLEMLSFPSTKETTKNTYPPPLLVQDLNVLHEVFLI